MGAENQNFKIYTGDTKIANFTATLPEGKTLASATIIWEMYDRRGKAVLRKETGGNGIEIIGGNRFRVTLNADETRNIALETHTHQTKMIDGIGQECTIAEGKVIVEKGRIVEWVGEEM